jgi:hypothetical protein
MSIYRMFLKINQSFSAFISNEYGQ